MRKWLSMLVLSLFLAPCALFGADAMPPGGPQKQASAVTDFDHTFLLHLPGIAGERWVDLQMSSGLRDAGYAGPMQTYDWTEHDPGLNALRAYKRNQSEAAKVAQLITDRFRADPNLRIILTAHSGGTGVVIWALEKLPADVKVDTVVLLSSALSPEYDLSAALSHVRRFCYSFYSENDVLVLATGTKLFGTIDGKYVESAGEFGFVLPNGADVKQYEKLVQKPFDRTWMRYDNIGDHMGPMRRSFSAHVLAPLLFDPAALARSVSLNKRNDER
jgi:pimeloyl-ACP methyl ester carboxylesterase